MEESFSNIFSRNFIKKTFENDLWHTIPEDITNSLLSTNKSNMGLIIEDVTGHCKARSLTSKDA